MNSLRPVLCVVLLSICATAFAQSDAQKPVAQSEAQKSFDRMKTLAGSWEGRVTTDMPQAAAAVEKTPMKVSIRATSRGNALLHEMTSAGSPDDPITMFYLEGDRLLLTHYCDAGNRPRMAATTSPDGRTVKFDFLDIAGSNLQQHMQHAAFTFIDADHHTEDWTFMMNDKPIHAHFDLRRAK